MNDYRFLFKLYGVRGSYPVTTGTKYGGNTTCVMTRTPSHVIFFDAGSGLIEAGKELIPEIISPSDDESKVMTPAEVNEIRSLCDVKLNVLVIDGTWQESVKIVNRTPYLKNVKRLAISQGEKSLFHLRRNQKDGNLCTSEAIAAAMMQLGFENESKVLNDLTELFLKKYEKGRGGYGL